VRQRKFEHDIYCTMKTHEVLTFPNDKSYMSKDSLKTKHDNKVLEKKGGGELKNDVEKKA